MITPATAMSHTVVDSPIGALTLVARDDALHALYMGDLSVGEHRHAPDPASFGRPATTDGGVLGRAAAQLAEYFSGTRTTFDLPLDVDGVLTEATARWRPRSAVPGRRGPWGWPTGATRSASWSPATASSAPAGP
jgi:methylated-DNA-[protein]-cysteine S-methyltransferase